MRCKSRGGGDKGGDRGGGREIRGGGKGGDIGRGRGGNSYFLAPDTVYLLTHDYTKEKKNLKSKRYS